MPDQMDEVLVYIGWERPVDEFAEFHEDAPPQQTPEDAQILSEMCSRLYEQDRQSQTYTPWDPKEGWNDPPKRSKRPD
jgi:hypothetical protein